MIDSIPTIHILFPDGHEDEMILEKFFASPEDRIVNKDHCNYIGHLKNDAGACVAVSGCHGIEDLHFTVLSIHSGPFFTFTLDTEGTLKHIPVKVS